MGEKKFIDKKKWATFQLMARDTSHPNYSSEPLDDRVFVPVDNNPYTPAFEDELSDHPDSIYADAPEDYDAGYGCGEMGAHESEKPTLPDQIPREMLELGIPDDGYNYLAHLREIKSTGGGSTDFHNPKADSQDVKACDASWVEVSEKSDVAERSMYSVASKTVNVRFHTVLDPEIDAVLDESNSSNFGSDVEDLEEDFVVKANLFEELATNSMTSSSFSVSCLGGEKPRARRPLDEQFDLLELNEYGSDNEEEFMRYMDEEECQESLAEKLNNTAFKFQRPYIKRFAPKQGSRRC